MCAGQKEASGKISLALEMKMKFYSIHPNNACYLKTLRIRPQQWVSVGNTFHILRIFQVFICKGPNVAYWV